MALSSLEDWLGLDLEQTWKQKDSKQNQSVFPQTQIKPLAMLSRERTVVPPESRTFPVASWPCVSLACYTGTGGPWLFCCFDLKLSSCLRCKYTSIRVAIVPF